MLIVSCPQKEMSTVLVSVSLELGILDNTDLALRVSLIRIKIWSYLSEGNTKIMVSFFLVIKNLNCQVDARTKKKEKKRGRGNGEEGHILFMR